MNAFEWALAVGLVLLMLCNLFLIRAMRIMSEIVTFRLLALEAWQKVFSPPSADFISRLNRVEAEINHHLMIRHNTSTADLTNVTIVTDP